ncbi:hypothetical protein SCOCK_160020 [Actinacidiphila cocklensis]|uniref:Uncharacterized protein n=1 Tax=Actinacidiphila cocklensis TaxID=887465 RepID=A0A9W4DMA4_9ACTN|nr:hypothetical protein SCOCK_160020 [Actinacidiphila cocklensis]
MRNLPVRQEHGRLAQPLGRLLGHHPARPVRREHAAPHLRRRHERPPPVLGRHRVRDARRLRAAHQELLRRGHLLQRRLPHQPRHRPHPLGLHRDRQPQLRQAARLHLRVTSEPAHHRHEGRTT